MMLLPRIQARKRIFLQLDDFLYPRVTSCLISRVLPDGEVVASLKRVHQKPVLEKTPEKPNSGTGEYSRPLSPGRLVMNYNRK